MSDFEPLMTVQEVADILRCSRDKVHRLVRRRKLAAVQSEGTRLFQRSAVAAYLQACTTGVGAAPALPEPPAEIKRGRGRPPATPPAEWQDRIKSI
jgi:excisionase family DNA binding protein